MEFLNSLPHLLVRAHELKVLELIISWVVFLDFTVLVDTFTRVYSLGGFLPRVLCRTGACSESELSELRWIPPGCSVDPVVGEWEII